MKTRVAWGCAASVLLSVCAGCAGDPGVIRGQSPDGVRTADAVYQPGYHIQPVSGCDACYSGQGYWGDGSWGDGCQGYWDGGFGGNHCRRDWYPTHHHWYKYKAPKNLVYPAANQLGGVVVYPYYTLKGPDDFFLQ